MVQDVCVVGDQTEKKTSGRSMQILSLGSPLSNSPLSQYGVRLQTTDQLKDPQNSRMTVRIHIIDTLIQIFIAQKQYFHENQHYKSPVSYLFFYFEYFFFLYMGVPYNYGFVDSENQLKNRKSTKQTIFQYTKQLVKDNSQGLMNNDALMCSGKILFTEVACQLCTIPL